VEYGEKKIVGTSASEQTVALESMKGPTKLHTEWRI